MLNLNLKFRKVFKKQLKKGINLSCNINIHESVTSLIATERGILTEKQIESARRVISRYTRRRGKVQILKPANQPITSKPNEIRMGKGKGSVNQYVRYIRAGDKLFSIVGNTKSMNTKALISASKKLPISTKLI